jgi:hypothetical protein
MKWKIIVLLIAVLPQLSLGLSLFLKKPTENVLSVRKKKKRVFVAKNPNVERFLHYISQLETSSGKNLNHKPVTRGVNAGDTAEGVYGIMPNTMDELDNRYPTAFNENSTPEDYAAKLAEHVLKKANNDETLAAGLWNYGHNAKPSEFDQVRNTDYAKKYDAMRKEIPQALDPNPYQQENQEKQQDFLKLRNLLKK